MIEDAAQAFGARYLGGIDGDVESPDGDVDGRRVGTIGTVGAFSFYPTKNLGGFGDGGLVATDSVELAARIRALGNHGASAWSRFDHEAVGCNSRLDEIQAALLRVRLRGVDAAIERRRSVAHDTTTRSAHFPASSSSYHPESHLQPVHRAASLRASRSRGRRATTGAHRLRRLLPHIGEREPRVYGAPWGIARNGPGRRRVLARPEPSDGAGRRRHRRADTGCTRAGTAVSRALASRRTGQCNGRRCRRTFVLDDEHGRS